MTTLRADSDPARATDRLHAQCVLAAATPSTWAPRAIAFLPTLLVEQAHLEKKAAAAATRFLFQVPQQAWMQKALSVLAREELVHFERTLRILRTRGIDYTAQPPSQYAQQLKTILARHIPQRLGDELLLGALIEARSHERMLLLADALRGIDDEAAQFYDELVEAEARHRCTYLDIAAAGLGEAAVLQRWPLLAAHEAAAVAGPFAGRLHGGGGDDDG